MPTMKEDRKLYNWIVQNHKSTASFEEMFQATEDVAVRTKEEKNELLKMSFMIYLRLELELNQNKKIIENLYSIAFPNDCYAMLPNMGLSKTGTISLEDEFYIDMIISMGDVVAQDKMLREAFLSSYRDNYKVDYLYIRDEHSTDVRNLLKHLKGKSPNISNYEVYDSKLLKLYKKVYDIFESDPYEKKFYLYVLKLHLCTVDDWHGISKIEINDVYNAVFAEDNTVQDMENRFQEKMLKHIEWTDSVFDSSAYKKYIKNSLSSFENLLGSSLEEEETRISKIKSLEDPFTYNLMYLLKKHHINEVDFLRGYADYELDLSGNLEFLYRSKLIHHWMDEKLKSDDKISQLDITRYNLPDMKVSEQEYLYTLIHNDVLLTMCKQVKEEYYKLRLNKAYDEGNDRKQLIYMIDKNKSDIDALQRLNENLKSENAHLKSLNQKDMSAKQLEIELYNNTQEKKLQNAEKEICRLNEMVLSQNRFFEELQKAPEVIEKKEINISELQNHKYLFVGSVSANLSELKRTFRNSIFMETATSDISRIKVDGIVYMIRFMSHAMFYKAQNIFAFREIPIVYFNETNIERLYAVMDKNFPFINQ